jgi:hypothetical protein
MAGIRIEGSDGTQITGDAAASALRVNGPATPSQAGFTKIAGKDGEQLKVTSTGYLQVSTENLEFMDTIDGAAVNTNLWNQSASTMTITQANSQVNLNPTNSTTANAYAILSSIQNFWLSGTNPLYIRFSLQPSATNLPANTVMEFGWGTCATNAAPTDGVFVRLVNGSAYLVLNNNGTETTQSFTLPVAGETAEYWFHIYGTGAKLYVNNVLVGPGNGALSLASPVSLPAVTNNNRQPVFFRVYNSASVPASSPTLRLGQISVQNINAQFEKPLVDKLVGMGRGGYQSPITTFAQTANHANSTSPTSATLSNTAAGYTTLGGRFQFAAPAGAVTDFALFGFQVPAGYQLYVKGVYIDCVNTGAAVATTATVLDWAIGVNASAVSLATADGAGTWAPRRIPIGVQSWIVGAAIGAPVECVKRKFGSPLVVDGGRFFHVIVQVPVGTATASQVIRGDVFVDAYFE